MLPQGHDRSLSVIHEAIVRIFQIGAFAEIRGPASFKMQKSYFLVIPFRTDSHFDVAFRESPSLRRLNDSGFRLIGKKPLGSGCRCGELEYRSLRSNKAA
jgi:hypothetical protein